MPGKNTVERVTKLIVAPLADLGYELYDLEYAKEGQNWYLRIYIDKDGGVGIDDCELVSRSVEKILDEADPISQSYILEVSSPGIDRALKKDADFEKYAGRLIDIKLYKAVDKHKEYRGVLLERKDGRVYFSDENGETRDFSRDEIASVRLAVVF